MVFVPNPHLVRQASIIVAAPNFNDGFVLFSEDFPALIDAAARWYLMNEGVGTNVADRSSNGDDGTFGAPVPLWTGTPSIDFVDNTREVDLPAGLNSLFVGEWTVFIVCNGNSDGKLVSAGTGAANYGQTELASGKLRIGTEDGGGLFWVQDTTNSVPATGWFSVASVASISGGRYSALQGYIDAVSETMVVSVESAPHPVPPAAGTTRFSDNTWAAILGYPGEMALAILIPGYAASAADITALHAWAAEILAPRGITI